MAGMNGGGDAPVEIDVDPAVFQDFADLEKEFAKVELDALRRKEFALRDLYTKRNALSSQIPNFWPAVLMNGPQELQETFGPADLETLAAVKSLNVERYQITSETEGEPRSLRFTFEFDQNDWFEDTKVVKEFRFVENIYNNDVDENRDIDNADDDDYDQGPVGALISVPVTFKWKKKGKKLNNGLLDLAVDLYRAEEAVRLTDAKSGRDLHVVEREGLWQYEKLRERLSKLEAENEDGPDPTWLDWFGYRGPVSGKAKPSQQQHKQDHKAKDSKTNGKGSSTSRRHDKDGGNQDHDMHSNSSDDEEDEEDAMLDVEIYPIGEEIANVLADDLWPNVMDYFMASQQEPMIDDFDGLDSDDVDIDDDDEDEEDAPDLVEAAGEEEERRPAKRQKKT